MISIMAPVFTGELRKVSKLALPCRHLRSLIGCGKEEKKVEVKKVAEAPPPPPSIEIKIVMSGR